MEFDDQTYFRILDNLNDGLYFVDTNRKINYWNKGAERISGFSAAEVVGRSCADNILTHVDNRGNFLCSGLCPLATTIVDGQDRQAEVFLHHKDGHRVPVFVRVSALKDESGKIIGGIEIFSEVNTLLLNSARVQELQKLALLDNLTQMPNRHYLEREIQARFEEIKRFNIPFGLLFMDIDHFKKVNDTYGHGVGDEVLKYIAATFVNNSRPFDLYGRWGGEEFIGIVRNIGEQDLALLGNRLRILVEQSYILHDNAKLSVTISLGATFAKSTDTMETLLKRADTLLYTSKQQGRNRLTLG